MRNDLKFEELHQIISVSEHTFISPIMEKAAQYLLDVRNEEGDWGYYKGLPTDIHASSLAIEALRACKDHVIESCAAEDATARMKNVIINNLDSFGIQQLVDALNILFSTESRDSVLESNVVARLDDLRNNAGWGDSEPSLSLSCEVILALMKTEKPPQKIIQQWVDYLVQYQQSEDGGWGATPDSKSVIISTSQALHVLNHFSDISLVETRTASIDFLQKYFQTKGWNELSDIFAISTVLRPLSELEDIPFEIIQSGIDSLYEKVNADGGWGAAKGETSNVENTALSIIALSSAGENKFVPSKLNRAALETAEVELAQLQNELDGLSKEIEQRVQKEMKNIIQERNELLKKVKSYKEESNNLEEKVSELRIELKATKEKNVQDIRYFNYGWKPRPILDYRSTIVVIFITIVSIGVYIFLDNSSLVAIIGLVFLSIYFSILVRTKSTRHYDLRFNPEIEYTVYELLDLMAGLPPSMREEIIFQLMRVAANTNQTEFIDESRFMAENSSRRNMDFVQVRKILLKLSMLPPSARLAVLDEVRQRSRL